MINAQDFHIYPDGKDLRHTFVGQKLRDVPVPAAIIDRAVVKRNCDRMLGACKDLKVGFRAHTKTHKVYHNPMLLQYCSTSAEKIDTPIYCIAIFFPSTCFR